MHSNAGKPADPSQGRELEVPGLLRQPVAEVLAIRSISIPFVESRQNLHKQSILVSQDQLTHVHSPAAVIMIPFSSFVFSALKAAGGLPSNQYHINVQVGEY